MPRPKPGLEEAKKKRQQRNQKYRDKECNKERDRLYRQRRRAQARLPAIQARMTMESCGSGVCDWSDVSTTKNVTMESCV